MKLIKNETTIWRLFLPLPHSSLCIGIYMCYVCIPYDTINTNKLQQKIPNTVTTIITSRNQKYRVSINHHFILSPLSLFLLYLLVYI